MRGAVVVVAALAFAGACARPAPAPADLDGIAHFLWQERGKGDDDALTDALAKLQHALPAPQGDTAFTTGSLTNLARDEVRRERPDVDPARGRGLFLADALPCTIEQVADLLAAPDTQALYPDVFARYDRTMHGDVGHFLRGDDDALRWSLTLRFENPLASYDERLEGGVRRVAGALVQDAFMTSPAVFDGPSRATFPYDFQIEAYWPRAGGVGHYLGFWREVHVNALYDTNNDAALSFLVDAAHQWDEKTAKLCGHR